MSKDKILELSDKAVNQFFEHRNTCQLIEKELEKISTVEIYEVLYQMSDGLVVSIPYRGNDNCPDNIPIKDFLRMYTK